MESILIDEIFKTLNAQIITMIAQVIVAGAIVMAVKDLSLKVFHFLSLKLSDWGIGTKIEVGGYEGHIYSIGFSTIIIKLGENKFLYMPISEFVSKSKVISTEI